MGLELSNLTAKLVGIEGLTFGVYEAMVKVNQAKDTDANAATNPAKLDFTTFFIGATGLLPASVPNVDASVDTEVQGSVALNAFGVLIAKGSFNLQLGTVTKPSTVYQAMVLTLGTEAFSGAQAAQVFIGVGGTLRAVNGVDTEGDG